MDDSQITDPRARTIADARQAFKADADPASLIPLFADNATASAAAGWMSR